MKLTNTVTYYDTATITAVKSFIVQALSPPESGAPKGSLNWVGSSLTQIHKTWLERLVRTSTLVY
jgi:hypothetical protein